MWGANPARWVPFFCPTGLTLAQQGRYPPPVPTTRSSSCSLTGPTARLTASPPEYPPVPTTCSSSRSLTGPTACLTASPPEHRTAIGFFLWEVNRQPPTILLTTQKNYLQYHTLLTLTYNTTNRATYNTTDGVPYKTTYGATVLTL